MSTPGTILNDERCVRCGSVYGVTRVERPERGAGKFKCGCGQLMRIWDEPGSYRYEPLEALALGAPAG